MKTNITSIVCAFTLSIFVSIANAALIDRGGGLIYDTALNVTWLSDANYGNSGQLFWSNANSWAANLSYYDSVRNVTYTDWRLPTTLQSDPSCVSPYSDGLYASNCSGSEMGELFYNELGGVAGQGITTTHNSNYSLFQNIKSYAYWSGTEYSPGSGFAWFFDFSDGIQSAYFKESLQGGNPLYVWAVRPGDVAAVPVPAASWLLGSGLLGLIGVARRKAA